MSLRSAFPWLVMSTLLTACPPATSQDVPRITLEGGVADASCPDGEVNDPALGRCVSVSEYFGDEVCDANGSANPQVLEDAVEDLVRADFCCFTQNNLLYWCPMASGQNVPLGGQCSCPDPSTGIWWQGVTCGDP